MHPAVACVAAAAALVLLVVLWPLLLALVALVRRRSLGVGATPMRNSRLCVGRVVHRRLRPSGAAHAFSYPIFMALVDLREADALLSARLWLSLSSTQPASGSRTTVR